MPILVYLFTYSVLVSCAIILTLLEMHTLSPIEINYGNSASKG